jgi:hypothetical protein
MRANRRNEQRYLHGGCVLPAAAISRNVGNAVPSRAVDVAERDRVCARRVPQAFHRRHVVAQATHKEPFSFRGSVTNH